MEQLAEWARAYGEELKEGEGYSTQPPAICVAFVNSSLDDGDTRQAYQKRQDEIMLYNKRIRDYMQIAEQANLRAETAESEIEKLRKEIEELRAGKTT